MTNENFKITLQVMQVLTPNFHSNSVAPYLTLNIQYIASSMIRQLSQSGIPLQVSHFLLSDIKMKAFKLKRFFYCLQVEPVDDGQKLNPQCLSAKVHAVLVLRCTGSCGFVRMP